MEELIIKFLVYGHTNKGRGVIKEIEAKNSAEALDKARELYPKCRFNHVNIA